MPIPQSLYIHIPWCVRKCPYCDFNSHALRGAIDEAGYVRHLLADLAHDLDPRPIESIFIGGGTPSLFSAAAIAALLDGINRQSPLPENCEITLEANPGTFEQAKFADYRAAGVNRLSIGVQSFDAAQLHALGRIHNRDEAIRAVAIAEKAGFQRINLDLMFALPGQDVAGALADLRQATALAPEHISWYQLTLEPNTAFYANPPALPDSDTQIDIFEAGSAHLVAHGYRQYETSAWRAGAPCRHNLNYWQFGDYIGIGAGAHGKISSHSGITRTTRARHPRSYLAAMQGNPADAVERFQVAPSELPFEFMLNAMRLTGGVPARLFQERTGHSLAAIARPLQEATRLGLIDPNPTLLRPTERGQRYLNDLLQLFL